MKTAPQYALAAFSFLTLLCAPNADAQIMVQRPTKASATKASVSAAQKGRSQRYSPKATKAIAKKITAKLTAGKTLSDASVRRELAAAPLKARLDVFRQAAKRNGHTVASFKRRLRGMLRSGKTNRVVKAEKTFFEVTSDTIDTFRQSMGENVVWFASSAAPYHLHTLLADQNGGPQLTHNTYGQTIDQASITRLQYMAPAQLDKAQMTRFVDYLNAGTHAEQKSRVYGFKNSKGNWVQEIRCTNWATSAPIGNLHRWIKTVDKKIAKAAKAGQLDVGVYGKGLHAALASAEGAEARATLIQTAIQNGGLSNWSINSTKRLGKEFNDIQQRFPERSLDLVGRESLSKLLGLNRSETPAKWLYDLALSKSVPVIGVLATNKTAKFKELPLDMGIMGTFNAAGEVTASKNQNKPPIGGIPAERGGTL